MRAPRARPKAVPGPRAAVLARPPDPRCWHEAASVALTSAGAVGGFVPFCPECKSMAYPKDGKLSCRKCGWTSSGPTEKKVVTTTAEARERVVIEKSEDPRAQQDAECPKCGHGKAYFHLMQTRRSDEPPTEINECMKCGHSWREY